MNEEQQIFRVFEEHLEPNCGVLYDIWFHIIKDTNVPSIDAFKAYVVIDGIVSQLITPEGPPTTTDKAGLLLRLYALGLIN